MHGYHDGEVEEWVNFFLDGVIETANESINISKQITKLREEDMAKIQALAKRESESGVLILRKLFSRPIIGTRNIMEWTARYQPIDTSSYQASLCVLFNISTASWMLSAQRKGHDTSSKPCSFLKRFCGLTITKRA
ncbi:MAG: hypothetical protein COW32_05050 [Candidatus Aquicultor secundus]|uniref:Uncharacterized protein n=1 Tax=Candidatus Aquicultor secundus TaxID=1973895 RepID=A0A2M7T742_9ACTN|nr:MAG: hypothetical protein AUK32_09200 [Candidatus Aquicultor secundus]PIU26288.1 MAG: hypothetical protein COT10_09405 [Candidatus Aquicultor secundus]PIW22344.1 MAG: hypothetical protein COW32_05050 [Candidatus Aquicultor secundus]PIX51235.1 MAG: hypothetical protein COZ51_10720 [Candidatus Aquicultor secundus]PIY37646.1 MAG: hypothetical protein COZ03_09765 [Candidatus Aquicultor secundus]